MKSNFLPSTLRLAMCLVSISTALIQLFGAPAFARGGGGHWGSGYVVREQRQAGLWYGDAFVPDDIKAQTYSNYQSNNPNSPYNPNNPNNPNSVDYSGTRGIAATGSTGQAVAASCAPVGQQFSGPAHIEPEQYRYFVQTYNWK